MRQKSKKPVKVMIGGVPFGRSNIGDEAILEGMVRLIRKIDPNIQITVSTHDQIKTPRKLNVQTCPLFGFSHVKYEQKDVVECLQRHDLYIWCGATGLSDYPEDALGILDLCHELKIPSVVFGTGMNSELNPVKYKIQPGLKKNLLNIIKSASLGLLDPVNLYEKSLLKQTQRHIQQTLCHPELVVLRDKDSAKLVAQYCTTRNISFAADPAIVIPKSQNLNQVLSKKAIKMLASNKKKIGICISAQREVKQFKELTATIESWIDTYDAEIFFIPMNPITDKGLMIKMLDNIKNKEACIVVQNCLEPTDIASLTSKMDVVISSRLHLLILASISSIPLIGISRGSKVDSFLNQYGLTASGSVDDLNIPHLNAQVKQFLKDGDSFRLTGHHVRTNMLNNLQLALKQLKGTILKLSHKGVCHA
jgi:polysaccharide pyruvyl transferase WcaK-like protein